MKRKKNNRSSRKTSPANRTQLQSKKTFLSWFNIIWKIVVGLSVVGGIVSGYDPFMELFTTSKDTFEKEYYVQGDLTSPKVSEDITRPFEKSDAPLIFLPISNKLIGPIVKGVHVAFDKDNYLSFMIGGETFAANKTDLENGIKLFLARDSKCNGDYSLVIGVRDNRLYVSLEFKDLKKEETIGIIEYNHWKLYKPNLLDWKETDRSLTVRDKQNYIVFAIEFREKNVIMISGYFIGESAITIVPTFSINQMYSYCISKTDTNWKKKAGIQISKIKPPL